MAEHVTSLCERILRESRENFVASLATEPLTVDMRNLIERWYSDRAFLAEQAKLLWERLDTATEEVERLRAEKGIVAVQRDAARQRDNVRLVASLEAEVKRLRDETKESTK